MGTGKQKAPDLKTVFAGPIGSISGGIWKDGWTRRSYIDLGPYRLRTVIIREEVSSALSEATDDPNVVVRVGHYLFWRWALSVTSDGHTERHGIFSFLFHSLIITILVSMVNSVIFWVFGALGWVLVAIWALHMYLNFSARFGSAMPDRDAMPGAG